MKDGNVVAQGSYEELEEHPYMKEVQDIHTKNKRQIQEANLAEAFDDIALESKSKSTATHSSGKLNTPDLLRRKSTTARGNHQPSQSGEESQHKSSISHE